MGDLVCLVVIFLLIFIGICAVLAEKPKEEVNLTWDADRWLGKLVGFFGFVMLLCYSFSVQDRIENAIAPYRERIEHSTEVVDRGALYVVVKNEDGSVKNLPYRRDEIELKKLPKQDNVFVLSDYYRWHWYGKRLQKGYLVHYVW